MSWTLKFQLTEWKSQTQLKANTSVCTDLLSRIYNQLWVMSPSMVSYWCHNPEIMCAVYCTTKNFKTFTMFLLSNSNVMLHKYWWYNGRHQCDWVDIDMKWGIHVTANDVWRRKPTNLPSKKDRQDHPANGEFMVISTSS